MADVPALVDQLVAIKRQQEALKTKQSEIEAHILKIAQAELESTKLKTVVYQGAGGNQVSATMSESLKVIYPSFLQKVFGPAYGDAVTEETKYKISASATRMLIGLWSKNYIRMTVSQAIDQITADPANRKALLKKVKGANFANDKKNIMAICGVDEKAAEAYAYFVAEAAVWENFLRLLKLQELPEDKEQQYLTWVDGAVVVEETPKIAVVIGDDV